VAIAAGALLLLALFLIRPGANHLRTRIVDSISLALGRPVDVASVSLRLLPQPGFDLRNFVIHDDPTFSAEPMLRAQEVTASLRVTSLLRGRLEIARLSLGEPSLNLVRDADGHWNLENLVERASKITVAPTGKAKMERRPGFPYIEADRGRINFKSGSEKTPYALTDADFALWQDSENAWGMRLKAQPIRTDFNLTDTGLITATGSWARANTLRETPMQISLQWDQAQLGQVTKLTYGSDKGWRGGLKIAVTLNGTPANLAIAASASVKDFRRYDILGGGDLRLATNCSGRYSSPERKLSEISCTAPVGDGIVVITGEINSLMRPRDYDLALAAQDLPIQSLIAFARHAKQNVPDDVIATGKLGGSLKIHNSASNPSGSPTWEGDGETSDFQLGSKLTNTELALGKIPFAISSAVSSKSLTTNTKTSPPSENRLEVGPFDLALGRSTPATVRGWASRSGYNFNVQGDAQIQRLLQLARTVGIPVPQPAAEGLAKVDLQIAGAWPGFVAPKTTGKVQLHAVRVEVRGLNAPLEVSSANLLLTPEQVNLQNLTASIAGTSWHGSVSLPRPCPLPTSCMARFDLHADEIAIDRLNQLLNPQVRKQPWYHFLSSSSPKVPFLLAVHATGKLTVNRVLVHKLVANRVSATVDLDKGKLRLSDLRGDVLGGKHMGEWTADFTAKPPAYSGNGSLDRIALDQLATNMNDDWITGLATVTYRANITGLEGAELVASATGTLNIDARDGLLRHLTLPEGSSPLQMHRLAARLVLHEGEFEIQDGKLDASSGIYRMSGTASMTRVLNVKLMQEGASGFNITGTLTEPHVSPSLTSATQAALKP
jgi:hypothetical protein